MWEHTPPDAHGVGAGAFTQLTSGHLVAAFGSTVMLYDGDDWQALDSEGFKFARVVGLHASEDDSIVVLAQNQFGQFKRSESGVFQYADLLSGFGTSEGEIFHSLIAHAGGYWALSNQRVLWHGADGSSGALAQGSLVAVGHAGGVALWERGTGLLQLSPQAAWPPKIELQLPVARLDRVLEMTTWEDDGVLLLSNQQLWRFRNGELSGLLDDTVRAAFREHSLRKVSRLRGGLYALGFGRGWPVLMRATADGLEMDWQLENPRADLGHADEFFEDSEGTLWYGQSNNLLEIDLGSGVTFFAQRAQDEPFLMTQATDLVRYRSRLLIGGYGGLSVLEPATEREAAHLRLIARQPAVGLAADGDRLYSAGGALDEIVLDPQNLTLLRSRRLARGVGVMRDVAVSRFHPHRLYAAGDGFNLVVTDLDRDEPVAHHMGGLAGLGVQIVEEDASTVWQSAANVGPWRIQLAPDGRQLAALKLDAGHGRDPEQFMHVQPGIERPWFASTNGLYRFNAESEKLERSGLSGLAQQAESRFFRVLEDQRGHVYLRHRDGLSAYFREGDRYRFVERLLGAEDARPVVFALLAEGDILWALRDSELLRVDLRLTGQPRRLPPVFLEGVTDSLLDTRVHRQTYSGELRNVNFAYALPSHAQPQPVQFRSQLVGFDSGMSSWSAARTRSYTNLPDGVYQFHIEARDAAGRTSTLSVPYRLTVTPPWYRRWYAYSVYGALALLALWTSARLGARRRQRQMLARQQELERIVDLRTSELRTSNSQLAEQAEQLKAVDRLKTRFFVNVGHEFRTPLTLVLGPLDDLLRDTRERLSERVRAQLELAQRNARRVLDLIVELLDVNRLEQGQLSLRRGRHDLVPLLQHLGQESIPLVERYGQTLRVDLGEQGAAPCHIDPLQIDRALSNLIVNAAKYSPRGTAIELRLTREDAGYAIAVRDQGRGIAAEALPHVFDRFFQTDDNDHASGYGIGLSLVREIALAHGGEVSVSSVLGVGSCFVLHLPAALPASVPVEPADIIPVHDATGSAPDTGPDAMEAGDEAPAASLQVRGRERVLVIDDHEDLRQRVRDLLSPRYEVLEAADGDSAWQIARDELPDLVVSDVMMPGCDGVTLTRRLRSHADTQAIGILLLTAKVGSEHAVAGLAAGANDYLAKPFDASELLARCDAIVAHARRLQHRLAASTPAAPIEAIDRPDERWRQRLDQHIAAHLHEPEFGIEALARCMHADRSQLFRKCKDILGQSPSDYLRDARLTHGHRLLEQAAGNVSEVAYASGFDSLSSFTRAFKTRYGIPPSQVRGRAA